MDLNDKRVVVLGGTSGIGLAVAKRVGAEGGLVTVASSNKRRIDRALTALPPGARGHVVDLSDESSIEGFFEEIGEFDHLVYTAGEPLLMAELSEATLEQSKDFFAIRFWGAWLSVKYGAPRLRRGGSIVLSSGMASRRSRKGWSIVSSVCGATESLVRALAVELAPLRINLVCPGLVQTELWDGMADAARQTMYLRAEQNLLVGHAGRPDELAEAYLYLMKAGFTTGQIVVADGGASVG